jgi:hypothetical protein
MEEARATESRVRMGDTRRPFDIRPTIFILGFSVLLAGALIVVNTRSPADSVETAALRVLDEGAERVGARQVGAQSAGRQIVSPAVRPESIPLADGDATGVAGDVVIADTSDEDSNDGATSEGDGGSPPTTAVPAAAVTDAPGPAPATTNRPRVVSTTTASSRTTTSIRQTTTTRPATTTTRPATTTTTTAVVNGRYSVAQVIDGTIGAADGSNPNEESPMGRHDAPLYLPQSWNWAQGPTRNSAWGNLGSGQYAEFRCAVIPENGHNPPVPFRVNVRSGAYYQFVNGNWNKAFDVNLTSTANGAYLGQAGQLNSDPFSNGGPGRIEWRREADGSYSAPWNSSALMMHFWAGRRQSPASGQTAEFLTSELRLQQPDGQTVDLSQAKVLFQCGVDYYNSTGGQGTSVPGPGIAKYHRASSSWKAGLWVTLPGNAPAASAGDFRAWLEANLPPNVRP